MVKKNLYNSILKKVIGKSKIKTNPVFLKINKKKKLEKSAKKMSNKMTEPERVFAEMMNELEVFFESQKIVKNKIFDFYIPSKNLIIEVHGDYWHSNPLIYEGKELNKIQIKNQKNDIFKQFLAKNMGFDMEVVWEYDLKNNYKEQKERFKKILKNE